MNILSKIYGQTEGNANPEDIRENTAPDFPVNSFVLDDFTSKYVCFKRIPFVLDEYIWKSGAVSCITFSV